MINKINIYILKQILKSCFLIFFIFISIAWLLQLTRLFTLTNLVQIDIFNVVYLSFFLVPNLLTVIIPFIIIFGISLCFIKLNKDKEIIAIYALGMQLKPIKHSLYIFTSLLIIFYICLNFYISPIVYEKYKIKEFELRNKIDFNKIITSNFLKLNDKTTLDFRKKDNYFEDIFISFFDETENIIFAKKGKIKNENNKYIFQLQNGFKLSLSDDQIEKLEFVNYNLKVNDGNNSQFNNFDRNSFTIFDDIRNKDLLNIYFKIFDVLLPILIIYIFFKNNILKINFTLNNNLFFIIYSILILILNQVLKNSGLNFKIYSLSALSIILLSILILNIKNKYE